MELSSVDKSMLQRDQNVILGTYARTDIEFVKGEGVVLFDECNKPYLDFTSGIAVNSLGHSHPKIIKAVRLSKDNCHL